MTVSGEDAELIGLRIDGPPLRNVALPLSPGLTTLYGLNGAGKSRLLEAVNSTFEGMWSRPGKQRAAVFFRDGNRRSLLGRVFTELDFGYFSFSEEFDEDGRNEEAREWLAQTVADRIEQRWALRLLLQTADTGPINQADASRYRELALETARAGVYAFVPVGTTEPRWELWACGWRGRPEFDRMLDEFDLKQRELRALWDRFDEMDGPQAGQRGTHGHRDAEQDALDAGIALAAQNPLLEWHGGHDSDQVLFSDRAMDVVEGHPSDAFPDDGMPNPICYLGTASAPLPWECSAAVDIAHARARTVQAGAEHLGEDLSDLHDWAAETSEAVNRTLAAMLLDTPRLELEVGSEYDWLVGEALRWRTVHEDRWLRLPLDQLSRAEQYWAAFAILHHVRRPAVLLLDEPESALHRSAEEHMARGLAATVGEGEYRIAATHSPHLLDRPSSHVMRVHNDGAGTTVTAHTREDFEDLATLGLTPSDLLRRWRVWLLVEGHHEELILDTLYSQELHDARVYVLPLHAGRHLPVAIDSRLLWDFTDAHVVAVLDNIDAHALWGIWDEALQTAWAEGPDAAGDVLRKRLRASDKEPEKGFIQQFLSRAIQKGESTSSRITPFSLSRPDITDYLPLDILIPEAAGRTWDDLRDEQAKQAQGKPGAFKPWLEKRYGKATGRSIFSDESVRAAAESMERPSELDRLLRVCRREASPPAGDSSEGDRTE